MSRGESETGGSGFHFSQIIDFVYIMTKEEERGGRDLVTGSWLPVFSSEQILPLKKNDFITKN